MKPFLPRMRVCALAAVCCTLSVFAQATRLTVVLTNGERVEATLKTATASELVLDVAGAERKVPLATISQITVATQPAPPIDTAFNAFAAFQSVLAAGEPDASTYTQRLDALQAGAGFANGIGEWADIRMAMKAALSEYESAEKDWNNRIDRWMRAGYDLQWARELNRNADRERERLEDPTARSLRIGQRISARLGAGDRQMTEDLDGSTAGAFNDLWIVDLRTSGTVLIEMSSQIVTPHLLLVDANGRRLDNRRADFADATIRRRLSAGTYRIWAGGSAPREVGSYTLQVTVSR